MGLERSKNETSNQTPPDARVEEVATGVGKDEVITVILIAAACFLVGIGVVVGAVDKDDPKGLFGCLVSISGALLWPLVITFYLTRFLRKNSGSDNGAGGD